MKKTAICSAAAALMLFAANTVYAGYSQGQIGNVIDNAFSWQDNYASPNSSPGSNASDYYVMAMARMGKSYNYDSYIRITESVTPTTKQDGQRLIMANSACGQKMSSSFVAMFTYDAGFDTASDIAGALITLDCGGYNIVNSDMDKNTLVSALMSMQQSNGSFDNNVLSTAKAVIALSNYVNTVYELKAAEGSSSYTYNTNSSISAALDYLSDNQSTDGGFGSIMNTAYSVIALDSIGIDADNDTRFQNDGNSGVGYLISMQQDDGSILSSADDTAIASCALVSHLRAMQGKSKFFDFTRHDSPDAVSSEEAAPEENHAGEGSVSPAANTSQVAAPTPTQNIIQVTPMPTVSPEHSAINAESYGPFPFVGPKQETETDEDEDTAIAGIEEDDNDSDGMTGQTKGILIILSVLLLMAASVFYLYKSQPEAFKSLFKKIDAPPSEDGEEQKKEGLDAIDIENYEFVESELVNSYLDNFENMTADDLEKSTTEAEDGTAEAESSDITAPDDDEFIEIPKF